MQIVIPYAALPLPQLTSEDQIQYLTPEAFQEKFNIHYTKSLCC